MKLLKKKIYGQAFPRSEALSMLKTNADNINSHIIKCVVYRDSKFQDVNHWISEVVSWLEQAYKVSSKSKLKAENYQDTVFAWFGTTPTDAELNLYRFEEIYVKKSKDLYPEFEIGLEMIHQLYTVYRKIEELMLPIFLKTIEFNRNDIYLALKNILSNV